MGDPTSSPSDAGRSRLAIYRATDAPLLQDTDMMNYADEGPSAPHGSTGEAPEYGDRKLDRRSSGAQGRPAVSLPTLLTRTDGRIGETGGDRLLGLLDAGDPQRGPHGVAEVRSLGRAVPFRAAAACSARTRPRGRQTP